MAHVLVDGDVCDVADGYGAPPGAAGMVCAMLIILSTAGRYHHQPQQGSFCTGTVLLYLSGCALYVLGCMLVQKALCTVLASARQTERRQPLIGSRLQQPATA